MLLWNIASKNINENILSERLHVLLWKLVYSKDIARWWKYVFLTLLILPVVQCRLAKLYLQLTQCRSFCVLVKLPLSLSCAVLNDIFNFIIPVVMKLNSYKVWLNHWISFSQKFYVMWLLIIFIYVFVLFLLILRALYFI